MQQNASSGPWLCLSVTRGESGGTRRFRGKVAGAACPACPTLAATEAARASSLIPPPRRSACLRSLRLLSPRNTKPTVHGLCSLHPPCLSPCSLSPLSSLSLLSELTRQCQRGQHLLRRGALDDGLAARDGNGIAVVRIDNLAEAHLVALAGVLPLGGITQLLEQLACRREGAAVRRGHGHVAVRRRVVGNLERHGGEGMCSWGGRWVVVVGSKARAG
jgi:hypothetical protein